MILKSTNSAPNTYTVTKRILSRFITSAKFSYTTWHFILPTIYGEKENPKRLIPYILRAIREKEELCLTSGEQVRQYIYINEVVKIIDLAYQKQLTSGMYNIAGNEELSVKELVSMLFNYYGASLNTEVFGKAKRQDTGMKILKLDGTALTSFLGYRTNLRITDVIKEYETK